MRNGFCKNVLIIQSQTQSNSGADCAAPTLNTICLTCINLNLLVSMYQNQHQFLKQLNRLTRRSEHTRDYWSERDRNDWPESSRNLWKKRSLRSLLISWQIPKYRNMLRTQILVRKKNCSLKKMSHSQSTNLYKKKRRHLILRQYAREKSSTTTHYSECTRKDKTQHCLQYSKH